MMDRVNYHQGVQRQALVQCLQQIHEGGTQDWLVM
jgi:hypothetical protein